LGFSEATFLEGKSTWGWSEGESFLSEKPVM
jgi:hypothetical protein